METTDNCDEALYELIEVWQRISDSIQQIGESLFELFESVAAEESKQSKVSNYYNGYFKKKDEYLRNQMPTYKIERRVRKNLPYQRRNY